MASTNPLDKFVAPIAAGPQLRLPDMPKLADHIKGSILVLADAEAFDAANVQWRASAEKQINDQLAKAAPVPASKVT